MTDFHYDSDLIGGSLLVRESRLVAELLLDGVDQSGWDAAIKLHNVLQKRTVASAVRTAQTIRKRLERLEPVFFRALLHGDDELSRQVAFIAALERNLLLVEFMETVVRDAYKTRMESLSQYQWQDFLDERSFRDAAIHDWKESSRKKMGQVVFRMLAEVGYMKSTRSCVLQNVLVRPEVRVMLEDTGRFRIQRCMDISI